MSSNATISGGTARDPSDPSGPVDASSTIPSIAGAISRNSSRAFTISPSANVSHVEPGTQADHRSS